MVKLFVHLSDIHFGQEKGGKVVIHNDIKERLLEDVSKFMEDLNSHADGVIVSGDIAYSGKSDEYKQAGKWLDRIAGSVGCATTDIQVVPGNHDIDQEAISHVSEWMLQEIADKGEDSLDKFLETELEREMLYTRFNAYRQFAEGYDCPLDQDGGHAGDCTVEIAPNRSLRFIGLNTALICSKKDKEGGLLLGARQHVLPKTDGQELVVIGHHPLNWLQDSDEARRYLRSRARVFISGHEHMLSVNLDKINADSDLLMIAAGATIPPSANEIYTYTYNIIEFDWDQALDALCVIVHPRTWSEERKIFEADAALLGGKEPKFTLGSPQFKSSPLSSEAQLQQENNGTTNNDIPVIKHADQNTMDSEIVKGEQIQDIAKVTSQYPLLLLHFFRDLSPDQRMSVLVKLGVLPGDWSETLTHTIERRLLDSLNNNKQLDELEAAMNELNNK